MKSTSTALGQATVRVARPDVQTTIEPPEFTRLMTSAELLDADLDVEYLIPDILVKGQHGVVGGTHKSLKTRLSVDLAVSLSSGAPFLGAFPVVAQQRLAIWSGESGAATLKSQAMTVAESRGIDLRADGPLWSFDLPKLSRVDHLHYLERVVTDNGIQVCMIDPLYLTLLDARSSGDAPNIYAMGPRLAPVGEIGQRTGCTMIVIHHFSRGATRSATNDDPATLDMLSQSGVSEWARQWLLLQRRSPYTCDGNHELWFRAGGSAGHGSLWSIDAFEGTKATGRQWQVTVRSAEAAIQEAADQRADSRAAKAAQKKAAQAAKDIATIDKILNRQREPITAKKLRAKSGLSHERNMAALSDLIGTGHAIETTTTVNKREEIAYRYVANPGSIGAG